MSKITRVLVTVYAALFAVVGLGFWAAPALLAQRFNVEGLGISGLSTIRADLGGLFLTLAGLCFVGVQTRRRSLLIAAALMLSAIVVGRLIGWATSGELAGLAGMLAIEIVGVAVLAAHVRTLKLWPDEAPPKFLKTLAAVAAVLLAIGGLVAIAGHTPAVQDRLFARASEAAIQRNNAALLKDDALRVALCGTSSPLPSPKRAKACVAVIAGGKMWIVDSGPESTENLMQWGIPLDRVAGVLITHFHSDHIGDLDELNLQTWVAGRPAQLAVYGGPGVEQVVAGFNAAYAQDETYRTAHHTAALLPPATATMVGHPVAMPATGPRTAVVHDDGQLKITAIETNHAPVAPAYAYRFEYKGRSVVVTGDTTTDPRLIAGSRGADILFSEALNRDMVRTMERTARAAGRDRIAHIMADIQSYHIAPDEAADVANKAGVKLLVLYHLIPSPDNFMARRIFTRGLDGARRGEWDLAEDGSLYTLPVGSRDFRIGRVQPVMRLP
ncbi:MBL fold metallo-hydrolase [Phenylobacterium sp.]|uniref:MBL fold metallo-hydrolase n=1 Tax=Phenylobacterium sp. TaxID=1871053 RepID=UPI002EDB7644